MTDIENTMTDTKDAKLDTASHQAEEHVHGPDCSHSHSHSTVETFVRASPKVGRNDPCSCGSGKKFKKCCGCSSEAAH